MQAVHTNQVGGHECEGQLVVVLVVNLPQRVLLEVDVLPEPGEGNLAGLLVGVLALPVVKDECSTGQSLERVLGLRGRCGLLLLFSLLLLGLGGGLGLLLLLLLALLLGGDVLQRLGDELKLAGNSAVAGLVADSLVPSGDIGVGIAPLLVEEVLEAAGNDAGGEQVGESQALTNEVCVCHEVLLKDVDGLESGLLRILDVLLVVGVAAKNGAEPATEGAEDLSVGEGHPSQDGGVVLLGLSEQAGLLVLRGDWGASV